jgi:hypothetical protein
VIGGRHALGECNAMVMVFEICACIPTAREGGIGCRRDGNGNVSADTKVEHIS